MTRQRNKVGVSAFVKAQFPNPAGMSCLDLHGLYELSPSNKQLVDARLRIGEDTLAPYKSMIEPCASVEQPGWLALRQALWPDCTRDEHLLEMATFLADKERYGQFIAYSSARQPIGLAEASVRTDYVNGTSSSPVAFLEGLYVVPAARRKGVAASLVSAVCQWAQSVNCHELASDALLENEVSHAVHRALGFAETERVIFFRKALT
jgi:aminoglycoside 6'-N-acetyltransferase I